MKRALLPLLLLLLLALPAGAEQVQVTLEPETVGIDETVTLTIEVHDEGFSNLRFKPDFTLENFEIVAGPSQYDDMRFTNGTLSRTFRLSWELRPLGLGRARVHAITVLLRDGVVQLPDRRVRVQQEPTRQAQAGAPQREEEDPFRQFFGRMPNPWRREPERPEVFLQAVAQPERPVVGQQVVYTVYLYTREDIAATSPSALPAFRGFWVRDIQLPQQLPTEMVDLDGRRYGRVPLIKRALFPLRAGRYKLEPATIDLMVQRYDRSFFFSPPVARTEPVRLRTEATTIDVAPLPPAPPGFAGAVGKMSLTAQLDPPRVRLGEAATLTLRLAGVGNLQGIEPPRVKAPPGLTLLPPQQDGRDEVVGSAVRGNRTWRYAVVPDRAGRYTLESPDLTYFDPEARRYQVATAPALALTALAPPPPPAAKAAPGAQGGRAALASSIPRGGRWSALLPWLIALPWGFALVAALVRYRPGSATEPCGHAACLEEALREAAAEERPRQAAARIEDGWRAFLTARRGLPPGAPPAKWRELLAARGVDVETLDELTRLLEDVEYLRFAPQLSTTDALRTEALERSRRLLRRLR
ncbi:MAG: BatD family protein [Thermoanaerobaculia bacterium]